MISSRSQRVERTLPNTQVDQKEKYMMMNSGLSYLLSAFKMHLYRQYIVPVS